ncbi:heavy metal-associated isoprenylated plant protein 41-like [Panicum hallii]|uniref:heavy metal-associated isoprenylated plant protein 41-like n=1 Tax=Panicum hallii TaxID=206008 RepID=UPI000DF4DCA3|nr:heavy metal-associated isoprenylated plant protein 41-like [Panicum hallii]
MAVGVAAPEVGDPAAATLVGGGGAGGEAPLLAAGKEDPPPADGVPAVEVEGKGAAVRPSEGAPAAIAVEGEEEEEAHKDEDKSEAEAADGVPAVEVEGKGAAAPLERAPAVITVGGEERPTRPRKREAVAAEAEEGDEGEKWLGHYSSGQSILIVGDGDFSFSLALATAFGSGLNLVTTSLDTYEALRGKYSKAESNIMELKRLGATVLHGVDAKKMRFHANLKSSRFDRIVFIFPHAGFKGKENDMHMINLHKELLWGFFFNARHLVRRYGEIHVTHKTGLPYDRWDLEHLASGSSLAMVEKVPFQKEDYPGYNQKRGDGARCDEPFDLGACCTFKFQIGDLKKLKKRNGKRPGSIPSLGGSNIHPGNWTTDRARQHRQNADAPAALHS